METLCLQEITADGTAVYWGAHFVDCCYQLDIHDDYELIYVTKGCCEIYYQFKKIRLYENQAMLILPHSFHSTQTPESSELYNIAFPTEYVPVFDKAIQGLVAKESCYVPDKKLMQQLCRELIHRQCKSAVHLTAYANLICADFTDKNELVPYESSLPTENAMRAFRYIKEHYLEKITLNSVADAIGVNKYYLSKLLNKADPAGFLGFVKAFRLDYGKKLLCTTDESIAAIAKKLCYTNVDTFTQDFKKRFGMTPSCYKKQYKH